MNPITEQRAAYHALITQRAPARLSTGFVHRTPIARRLPSPTAPAGAGLVPKLIRPETQPGPRIRPFLSFNSSCDATPGTSTSTNGGPVIRNVSIQLLFWGVYWQNTPAPALAQVIASINTILQSPYLTGLIQYGVGPGSLQTAGVVTGLEPSNPVSDGSVQTMLSALFSQNSIPQPGPDNLYVVIPPANFSETSGPQFGGHHTFFGYNLLSSNFPFVWWGLVNHTGTLSSLTPLLWHEIVEALTDPAGNAVQVNPRNSSNWNELCDVCCSTFPVNGVLVASYWSDRDQACIVPTTLALAQQTSITCFGVGGNFSRVYYLDANNNVSELAWDGGWGFGDPLTGPAGATNAPPAVPGSALTCFGVNGDYSRVYYLNPTPATGFNTLDVHELYWDNGWKDNALTGNGGNAGGAPSAAPGSALTCFGVNGNSSRVYYTVSDVSLLGQSPPDIFELFWDNGWDYNQLTGANGKAQGAPSPVNGTALACFGVNGSASRVYYLKPTAGVNVNGLDVAELYWDNGWGYNVLTGSQGAAQGAPLAAPNSPLACFGVNGSASRVYYLVSNLSFTDPRLDVYELYWDNGWGFNQLTGLGGRAGGAPSALLGGLTCFGVNGSASRVYYHGPNDNVFELYWDNGWGFNQLTGAGGKTPAAPPAAPGAPLTCFGVNGSDSRVYYVDANNHLNELAWVNGGWVFNQLL